MIGEHDEGQSGHEELYVVLSGKATFTIDGETVDGPPGTILRPDPAAKRHAVADEPGTRILAVGAKRGEVFEPSTWERSPPAFPFFASGEYDRALEVLEAAHTEFPDDATVLYNLACAESMSGRTDGARAPAPVGRRRRAFLELARTDTDFDPIRDRPEFAEIVS